MEYEYVLPFRGQVKSIVFFIKYLEFVNLPMRYSFIFFLFKITIGVCGFCGLIDSQQLILNA